MSVFCLAGWETSSIAPHFLFFFCQKTIRKVVAQVQSSDRSSVSSQKHHTLALSLTSNSSFKGDLAQAVEQVGALRCLRWSTSRFTFHFTTAAACQVCTVDSRDMDQLGRIMRTIDYRLHDTSGLNWRHGHKALVLLRSLLLNGHVVSAGSHLNYTRRT